MMWRKLLASTKFCEHYCNSSSRRVMDFLNFSPPLFPASNARHPVHLIANPLIPIPYSSTTLRPFSKHRDPPSIDSAPPAPKQISNHSSTDTLMGATEEAVAIGAAPGKSDSAKINFKAIFPELVNELINDIEQKYDLPEEALAYIRRNVEYNVPHGKLNRGLAVFQCFKAFHEGSEGTAGTSISPEQERSANILGWCVELLQAYFLVADDIMDGSVTRRGQPCFYRLPDIGLKAINDSLVLEMMIYRLLRLHFRSSPIYIDLLELFQDITYTTELGQQLDLTSQEDGAVQLERFTDDALSRIYKYKTSHYTFYLPVALGMRLAGVTEQKHYDTAKRICLEMGYYFQAQDDYLDAFGDPEVTGKIGTDIEEKTCTWLVVQALKVTTDDDIKLLKENYGINNKENSDRVKELYVRLGLKEKFAKFESESYERMKVLIGEVNDMPVGAFEFLLSKIYKRDK